MDEELRLRMRFLLGCLLNDVRDGLQNSGSLTPETIDDWTAQVDRAVESLQSVKRRVHAAVTEGGGQ